MRRGPTEHKLMFPYITNSCHLDMDLMGADAPANQEELQWLDDDQGAQRQEEDMYAEFERQADAEVAHARAVATTQANADHDVDISWLANAMNNDIQLDEIVYETPPRL